MSQDRVCLLTLFLAAFFAAPMPALDQDAPAEQIGARLDGPGGLVVAFDAAGRQLLTAGGSQFQVRECSDLHAGTGVLDEGSELRTALISLDGKLVATAAAEHASVWDITSKRRSQSIQHPGEVLDLAFSPDGSRLLTACSDHIARVWDVQKGRLIREIRTRGTVRAVLFPTHDTLITCSSERILRIDREQKLPEIDRLSPATVAAWDAASGTLLWQTQPIPQEACRGRPVAHAVRALLAVPEGWNGFTVYELRSGHTIASACPCYLADGVNLIKFSADGTRLLALVDDGTECVEGAAHVFGLPEHLKSTEFHDPHGILKGKALHTGAISGDGSLIALVNTEGEPEGVWDVTLHRRVLNLTSHEAWKLNLQQPDGSIAFSPDEHYVAAACLTPGDGGTLLWNVGRSPRP